MVNILTFILILGKDKGQVTYFEVGCESDIFFSPKNKVPEGQRQTGFDGIFFILLTIQ